MAANKFHRQRRVHLLELSLQTYRRLVHDTSWILAGLLLFSYESFVGVKAEKIGMVSLVQDNSILSIFVKLPNVTAAGMPDIHEQSIIIN